MEFLVYADVHHDEYNNGITLDDTIAVEDQITEYALSHKVNLVIFAGDWYRATNPLQSVIKAAEASWKRRSDVGIVTIAIPGNHDRFTKSPTSDHAFGAVDIFQRDLSNVSIIDKVEVREIDGINFMFIPAGHEDTNVAPISNNPLIVIFHAMIADSKLANNASAKGISSEKFKSLNATLLFGGDNHTPQVIDHLIHHSRYLGAPLQHTWGDRGQVRGFYHVKMTGATYNIEQIQSQAPMFVKIKVPAKTEIEAICTSLEMLNKELNGRPGIIDITLLGNSNLDIDTIKSSIVKNVDHRQIRVIEDKTFDKLEIAPGIGKIEEPEDKWNAYVASGNAPGMENLDVKRLSEIGGWALQEARKDI